MRQTHDPGRNFDRLRELLREMFQLDRGDLDFGLYRIMCMKAGEIERFLDQDLLPQVKTVLSGVTDERRTALEAKLARAMRVARELGVDPEKAPAVAKIKEQLEEAKPDAATEADVYAHLANFFARYYSDGDFMSLRRYSSGGEPAYLIPYDGEEVKLHWANADQYYVKTTENYTSYAFLAGDGEAQFRVRFEVAAADNEKDNIKEANGKQRRFVLAQDAIALEEDGLVARFEHRPLSEPEKRKWPGNGTRQQGKINAGIVADILAAVEKLAPNLWRALVALVPTDADPDRTLLAKHVGRYTAKNSFDYFIHKDLGGFLRRELDLYLKTDVLDLQDLAVGDAERLRFSLAQIRAIREIGEKLIAFLAQLEDFQKRLWLKKKFVLETQWCVTLDRVPESFYLEIASNEAQWAEWRALFSIDDIAGAGSFGSALQDSGSAYSSGVDLAEPNHPPLAPDFLKANRNLVLDTRHFDQGFKDRLLAALSDSGSLEEYTDGVLVHGENFQALNLLKERYRRGVQCVYIDPPYNSPSSEILYKNNYKHSSWISLMRDRIDLSEHFLAEGGFFVCAIDENEERHLALLLDQVFCNKKRVCVSIVHNPRGIQGEDFSFTHESAHFVFNYGTKIGLRKLDDAKAKPLMKTGGESLRETARNCFYPIFVSGSNVVGFGDVPSDMFSPRDPVRDIGNGVVEVWPVSTSDNLERKWRYSRQSIEAVKDNLSVRSGKYGNPVVYLSKHHESYRTVWPDAAFNAAEHGSTLIKNFGLPGKFTYPKSVWTIYHSLCVSKVSKQGSVTDYFAGSGTTGHAVISLNREDGGKRKYILVEMGEHFDTVMLPRLKKIAYAPDWKNGEPMCRDKGTSQLIRYIRLESYEDTLDGLVVTPPPDDLLVANDPALVEDYRLRYALDEETASSPCLLGRYFRDPFAYTLSVVRDGARHETPVDLPETFNLLLGLQVESRRHLDGVLAIVGKSSQGQTRLILWRNLDETDNNALNDWLQRNRANLPDELDLIYANGDHTLNAVRQKKDIWQAATIEPLFRELMFTET